MGDEDAASMWRACEKHSPNLYHLYYMVHRCTYIFLG